MNLTIEGLNEKGLPIRVHIDNGIITKVEKISASKGLNYIIPGFIDAHTHGGYGFDFMDIGNENYETILKGFLSEGVTSTFATLITAPRNEIIEALDFAGTYAIDNSKRNDICKIVGLHTEATFLSVGAKGAHNIDWFERLDNEWVDRLVNTSKGQIKMVTYAPEETDASTAKYMHSRGIIGSAGHSFSDSKTIKEHVEIGLKKITHMFNGMKPFSHREPSIMNEAMLNDNLFCELICDGIHVNLEVVSLLKKVKTSKKIILVTDSLRPKGLPNGKYISGGFEVTKDETGIRLASGTLAGSSSSISEQIKIFKKATNATLKEIVDVSSRNVAKLAGLKLGEVKKGFVADLLVLDQNLNIIEIYKDGNKYNGN